MNAFSGPVLSSYGVHHTSEIRMSSYTICCLLALLEVNTREGLNDSPIVGIPVRIPELSDPHKCQRVVGVGSGSHNDHLGSVHAAGIFRAQCRGVCFSSAHERGVAKLRGELASELEGVEGRTLAGRGRQDVAGREEGGGQQGARVCCCGALRVGGFGHAGGR